MNLSRLSKFIPVAVSTLALVLLVFHTFGWGNLHVDTTSFFCLRSSFWPP
jgi:hypothetical protein